MSNVLLVLYFLSLLLPLRFDPKNMCFSAPNTARAYLALKDSSYFMLGVLGVGSAVVGPRFQRINVVRNRFLSKWFAFSPTRLLAVVLWSSVSSTVTVIEQGKSAALRAFLGDTLVRIVFYGYMPALVDWGFFVMHVLPYRWGRRPLLILSIINGMLAMLSLRLSVFSSNRGSCSFAGSRFSLAVNLTLELNDFLFATVIVGMLHQLAQKMKNMVPPTYRFSNLSRCQVQVTLDEDEKKSLPAGSEI